MDLRDASIFHAVCASQGLPEPVYEHRFAKSIGRQWRFDVAWPEQKVALEWEGITWYGNKQSRHQSAKGYEGDCEKYNTAVLLGWKVLRYPQRMQDRAISDLAKLLKP